MRPIPKRRLIPVITDLLEYRQAAINTIPYTQKMVARYGDVCDVSFTGVKNYFIHDPEVIKEILTTRGNKMKRTYLFQAFRKFLGNGLFTTEGEHHRQQRRLIKPAFYPERIQEYAAIMSDCAAAEMDSWTDGAEINLQEAMTRITLNAITRCMFGSGMSNEEVASVGRDLRAAFDITMQIVQNPFYAYCLIKDIRLPLIRKFYKKKEQLDNVVNNIISTYRKAGEERSDLLSLLLNARDEETGAGMSDEQIRDEVMTFFLAGHETTTLALTWTLYLIDKHPGVRQKLHDEVRTVIGDRTPQAADYPLLPYTRNVFRESLRLYPPAWTFAREPMEDMDIQGYHFPKGAVLWTITYLLHHDERYFRDAEAFIPERWDEEAAKQAPRYAYFPFGGGNRMCIGEGFAWMEGVLVLASVASRFDLKLREGFSTGINPVFTLKPKDDIIVKCQAVAQPVAQEAGV
jgi:cytochrome P450